MRLGDISSVAIIGIYLANREVISMHSINRNVVVIKAQQPFLDWINQHPDLDLSSPVTFEELQPDCTALLVPDLFGPDEVLDYLAAFKLRLFEMELESWHRDPATWPQNRTLQMFDAWFAFEIHSMVWDMANEAIVKEEEGPSFETVGLDIETYRQRVKDAFFPERFHEGLPALWEGQQAVSDYRKLTGDIAGTLDLMLTYVEAGTRFTNTYGDIDESFYGSLEAMLDDFADLLLAHPEPYAEADIAQRLGLLEREVYGIGWGYGDYTSDRIGEIKAYFGDL
ncbi:MAG: hypothetical protein GY803_15860 [Chloroflexi bacterium]|nr:hypothetical protein [Chloroflexota bacterium]